MKAIKELHIREFQSHEATALQFHPGLNVLVGPSDSGKSAIVRALRWCLHNEPRGEAFIRAMAAQGLTDAEIGERFGVSGPVIRLLRNRRGIEKSRVRALGVDQGDGAPQATPTAPKSRGVEMVGRIIRIEAPGTTLYGWLAWDSGDGHCRALGDVVREFLDSLADGWVGQPVVFRMGPAE